MKRFWKPAIFFTFLVFLTYMFLILTCTMQGFTGGTPQYSSYCSYADLFGGPGSGFNGIHEIITYLLISSIPGIVLGYLYKSIRK